MSEDSTSRVIVFPVRDFTQKSACHLSLIYCLTWQASHFIRRACHAGRVRRHAVICTRARSKRIQEWNCMQRLTNPYLIDFRTQTRTETIETTKPSLITLMRTMLMRTVVARTMLMRTVVVRTMVVRVALTSTLSYRPNFLGTPTASYLPQEKCARSNQDDTKTHMKLCTARENMRNELQQCSTVSLSPARRKHTRDVRTNSLRTRTKCSKSHQNDQKPTPKHSRKRAQSEG